MSTPARVGSSPGCFSSEWMGRATVLTVPVRRDGTSTPDRAQQLVEQVKRLDQPVTSSRAADGSFEMLVRRATEGYEELFELARIPVRQHPGPAR